MIRSLCPEFHLAQSLVHVTGRLPDRFCKQLISHEMGAGTSSKEAAVLYQLHGTEIDLTIALYCILYRITGLGESWGIQDHHIILLSLLFKLRQQFKYIPADELRSVLYTIQRCILRSLFHCQFRCIYTSNQRSPHSGQRNLYG